jgi:hypothetical protein
VYSRRHSGGNVEHFAALLLEVKKMTEAIIGPGDFLLPTSYVHLYIFCVFFVEPASQFSQILHA